MFHKLEYSVTSKGPCLLLIQKEPKWKIPSNYFGIAFTSDPKRVLNYGSNGLHYLEHILFNIINSKCDFFDGNAATYDDGTMIFYFIGEEDALESNLDNFFAALISVLDPKNHSKYGKLYKREQRRITTEVSDMPDVSVVSTMFSRNPEIYLGDYPREYIWYILLRECRLEKILLMAHCKCNIASKFTKYAEQFEKLWDQRMNIELPKSTIPYTAIMPPSLVMNKQVDTVDLALKASEECIIDLRTIDNPIIRMIIHSSLFHASTMYVSSPYLFDIKCKDIKPKIKLRIYDLTLCMKGYQYFLADIFMSSGSNITEKEINDIIKLSPPELLKKYGKNAKSILHKLVH